MTGREKPVEIAASNPAVLTPRAFIRDFSLEARHAQIRVVDENMLTEVDKAGYALYWILREKVPEGVEKDYILTEFQKQPAKALYLL